MLKNKKGFSLVELIVVIAILVVFAAVLIPSLLQYTENSRAQKDVSAMDEVVNAVQLAMADEECFDEMLQYSCNNNFMTYTDSSGNYGQQINDGEFWAPDGSGKATTITFNPVMNDNGAIYYELAKAYVNDMTMDNGSTTQERIMEGQIIDENQCYLKDASIDGQGMSKLYAYLKSAIGETFANTSQTYRNSSFTVFIRFTQKDGVTVADVYGQFNGTNLHDGAAASMGSGTTEYNVNTGDAITSISGGTMQAQFGTSDLIGTGTFCPSMTEERIEHNDKVVEGGSYQHADTGSWKDVDGDGDTEWTVEEGEKFEEGDEMPEPQIGDIYIYGDYEYHYNQWIYCYEERWEEEIYDEDGNFIGYEEYYYWDAYWEDRYYYREEWEDEFGNVEVYEDGEPFENGWSVVVRDKTKTTYGAILTEINGYPVNGLTYTFGGCSNLTDISFVKIPETTQNISYLFYECNNIERIPNSFKIPRYVDNAHGLFYGCDNITEIPKTLTPPSTLEDAGYMFAYTGITEIPVTFNLQKSTKSVYGLFAGTSIKEIPTTFVLSDSINNVSYMFYDCDELTKLNGFKLPASTKNASHIFYDCNKLIDISGFSIPTNTQDISWCFAYCRALTTIPNDFMLPDGIKDISYFFYGSAISDIPFNVTIPTSVTNASYFLGNTDITEAKNITLPNVSTISVSGFFAYCDKMSSVNENFIIGDKISNLSSFFSSCSQLTTIHENFCTPGTIKKANSMFSYCSKLTKIPNCIVLSSNATDATSMFYNCSSLVSLPEDFNIINVSCNQIVAGCKKLKSLPRNFLPNKSWGYSTTGFFYNCESLEYLPDGFNIPHGTAWVGKMFYNCKSLKKLPDGFCFPTTMDTRSCQSWAMSSMFYNCESLESLPNSFKFPTYIQGLDLSYMFYNCKSLKNAPELPSNTKEVQYMFYGCQNLEGNIKVSTSALYSTSSSYYNKCFYNTVKPIYLVPKDESCISVCEKMAGTDNNNNVSVGAKEITLSVINNSSDLISVNIPNKVYGNITEIELMPIGVGVVSSFKLNGETIIGNTFLAPAASSTVIISDVVIVQEWIVESEHNPYPNSLNYKVYGEKTFVGATSLTVVLETQTESNTFDWIEIYDKNGNQIKDPSDNNYKFGGTTRKTQTINVPGDYVKIVFRTDGSVNSYYGFKATVTPNN